MKHGTRPTCKAKVFPDRIFGSPVPGLMLMATQEFGEKPGNLFSFSWLTFKPDKFVSQACMAVLGSTEWRRQKHIIGKKTGNGFIWYCKNLFCYNLKQDSKWIVKYVQRFLSLLFHI